MKILYEELHLSEGCLVRSQNTWVPSDLTAPHNFGQAHFLWLKYFIDSEREEGREKEGKRKKNIDLVFHLFMSWFLYVSWQGDWLYNYLQRMDNEHTNLCGRAKKKNKTYVDPWYNATNYANTSDYYYVIFCRVFQHWVLISAQTS